MTVYTILTEAVKEAQIAINQIDRPVAVQAGKFKLMIERIPDNIASDSGHWLGEFSDRKTTKISYKYENCRDQIAFYNPPEDILDLKDYYQKNGYSKGVAEVKMREALNQARKRLEGLYQGEWEFMGIVVTLYEHCPCCGEWKERESSSLWGIESDSDPVYLNCVVDDLIAEVV